MMMSIRAAQPALLLLIVLVASVVVAPVEAIIPCSECDAGFQDNCDYCLVKIVDREDCPENEWDFASTDCDRVTEDGGFCDAEGECGTDAMYRSVCGKGRLELYQRVECSSEEDEEEEEEEEEEGAHCCWDSDCTDCPHVGENGEQCKGKGYHYFKASDGVCRRSDQDWDKVSCCSSDECSSCPYEGKSPEHCLAEGLPHFQDPKTNKCRRAEKQKASGGGDPHFKTWHGVSFNYHGQCDLVLAHIEDFDGKGTQLDLHARTDIRKFYSIISSAALRIGEETLEVSNNGIYMNGSEIEFPTKLSGYEATWQQLSRHHQRIKVVIDEDDSIRLHLYKNFVWVSTDAGYGSAFKGSKGLLGDFGLTGLVGRDGGPIDDANIYGQDWQVRADEPKLFVRDDHSPQAPDLCILPDMQPNRRMGSTHLRASAEEACAHWGADKEACIFDVLATGDLDMADAPHFEVV